MSNPSRGEVALSINGRTYLGRLNMNACRALQREYDGVPPARLLQAAADGSVMHVASTLWHAVRQQHPEVTIDDIDRWLDQYGVAYFGDFFAELVAVSVLGKKEAPGNAPAPVEIPPAAA